MDSNGLGASLPVANSIEAGRNRLNEWQATQPDNFFSADRNLQRTLEFHWGKQDYGRHAATFYRFGAEVATVVDTAVRLSNRDENLPRLERYDHLGNRTEEVIFHPSYHEAGRLIYGSGLLSAYAEPGQNLLALGLFYLSSLNGEAGHNCPVACTGGLIKVLQQAGSAELKSKYLPRLLDSNYDSRFHGAQFLTEVQGGSDVGANATVATLVDPAQGIWRLSGEKWFCSNVSADLALVTARVPEQGEGTRGLGLFLVPRRLDDGRLNDFHIRRLKDKLGTRSMPTAEVEFRDTLAYQVGPAADGFKNVMTHVINTSRLYNAVGVCGNARRAHLTAWTYAQHRGAFGYPIVHFPLVQDMLARMRADAVAMTSGTLRLVHTVDEIEQGQAGPETEGFLRMAINLNKYRTAVLGHGVIVQAIELLGGNGAIETFSVLPRLLRDNVVYENWEGTHNVLLAQVQRDIRRYQVHEPFLAVVRQLFESLSGAELRDEGLRYLDQLTAELTEVLAMDELTAAIYFRPLMDRLTDVYYLACLAGEGEWERQKKEDKTKLRLAALFLHLRVAGQAPSAVRYYDDQVSRLSSEF
jgi:acyl-CoA dehydrogenase